MLQLSRIKKFDSCTRAGNFYQDYVCTLSPRLAYSPISKEIIRGVSGHNKLFCCLLLISRLRFSELLLVNWSHWSAGQDQQIYMPKVNRHRNLVGLPDVESAPLIAPDPTIYIELLNYKSLRKAIKKVLPRHVNKTLARQRSYTHVFRHLEASWDAYHGIGSDTIADTLGHYDQETQLQYIHDFQFFSPKPKS